MKKIIIFAFSSIVAIACGNSSDDTHAAWNALNDALDSLYKNNYDAYIECVDSQDIALIGENTIRLLLKQKYDNVKQTETVSFLLDNAIVNDDSTANVGYKIIKEGGDTTFCSQKMKFVNGVWKIKLK